MSRSGSYIWNPWQSIRVTTESSDVDFLENVKMLPLGYFCFFLSAALSPPLGFAVGQQLSAEISPKLIRDGRAPILLWSGTVQRGLRKEKNLPKALKTQVLEGSIWSRRLKVFQKTSYQVTDDFCEM